MSTPARIAMVILGLAVGGLAIGAPPQTDLAPPPPPDSLPPAPTKPDAASAVFKKYHKWDRVTSKPVPVSGESGGRCSPTPGTTAALAGAEGYFQLYVSDMAKPVFALAPSTPFPEGAILVKELLAAPKGRDPRTLLAMVKREDGFDPANGNWEFFVLRVTDIPVVVDSGRITHCAQCHTRAKPQDFVFRNDLRKR